MCHSIGIFEGILAFVTSWKFIRNIDDLSCTWGLIYIFGLIKASIILWM